MSHVDRWKNRRRMAWASLVAGLVFPVLLLFTESSQLGSVAGAFYLFVGSVVGAYIGFATVDDKWTNNARHQTEGADRHWSAGRDIHSGMDRQWVEDQFKDGPYGGGARTTNSEGKR